MVSRARELCADHFKIFLNVGAGDAVDAFGVLVVIRDFDVVEAAQ